MFEKATALVASFDTLILEAIAAFGILTISVWTVLVKQGNAKDQG